ncbi:MAG TPA: hypothetical protein VFI31_20910, partial [Pirellulales bacterium]|nr:hypothetical protein [Pirellulales bacterium]
MREKESLFERIFKQPTSAAVLPEENLATEVVAYFLDAYPPFREAFLKKVGIQDEGGEWTVETQKALDARG